jgi:hypothetical protein
LDLHAQQASLVSPAEVAPDPANTLATPPPSNNSNSSSAEQSPAPDPAITFAPKWIMSSDSLGNVRQQIKIENDYAVGNRLLLGLLYAQSFIYDGQAGGTTENFRDAGIVGQWRPNDRVKLNGMAGFSQLGATVDSEGQSIAGTFLPIADLHAAYTSAGESVKLDLGFKRSLFDLSPELVANRVVRNDFVIHPQIGLESGWRFRELAEIGPVTSTEGGNYRYNSEFTVARQLAKNSELYSTFTALHYAQASAIGYFSPEMVHDLEAGWSTDIDRRAFAFSFDGGLGAGHAKEYGASFGSWGLSAHTQTDVTWKIRAGRDLHATYEFYYDRSAPPVESTTNAPWHMSILTIAFHWGWR